MRFIGQIRQFNFANRPRPVSGPVGFLALFVNLACIPVFAQGATDIATSVAEPPANSIQLVNSPLLPSYDFSEKSDYELTELGARWDNLSRPERDALLREVKLRMAQRKDSDGVLMIRTQRRYGRIYRSDDGRYLKIETKVVRVRPADPNQVAGTRSFGVGFEKRSAEVAPPAENAAAVGEVDRASTLDQPPSETPALQSPPVVRVSDPSR